MALLEIKDLQTQFFTSAGTVKAVDGVSYTVEEGETVAVVGESGSGKSVTAMSIMRLIPWPPGKIVGGSINFDGKDLLALSDDEMRSIRGRDIGMIFQEPMTSLNPVLTIGMQLTEPMIAHLGMSEEDAMAKAKKLLDMVGISEPDRRLAQYPHHLSGGMRQRVVIAMALACDPKLIIADEPTTALDVTIQAQILELMKNLTRELGVAMIIITHNLGVVARYADRVNVMYLGRIIESGSNAEVYEQPSHPYTQALLSAVPSPDPSLRAGRQRIVLQGDLPSPADPPSGCHFRTRCWKAQDICATEYPELIDRGQGHLSACHFATATDVIRGSAAVAPDDPLAPPAG